MRKVKYPLLWNRDWLEKKYTEEKLTGAEIANIVGCSEKAVIQMLHKHEITVRSISDARKTKYKKRHPELDDKEWLKKKYWDEGLTFAQIGEIIECDEETVSRTFRELGIPKRTQKEIMKIRIQKNPDFLSKLKKGISYNELWDKEWLYEKHVIEKYNCVEIANIIGCDKATVCTALKRFGIVGDDSFRLRYHLLRDRQWLEEKYVDECLLMSEIAEIVGCDTHTVKNALKKHGIPTREWGEAYKKQYKRVHPLVMDKQWLEEKYWVEELSFSEISKLIGCTRGRVSQAFEELGIEKRTHLQRLKLSERKRMIARRRTLAITKNNIKYVELGDKEWISEKYLKEGLSTAQIAKLLNCSRSAVKQSLRRFEIPRHVINHHTEETKEKIREARKHVKIPTHHTKPELIFLSFCKKDTLPFKYTGDGAFWIEGTPAINPDFIHLTEKIAVEIFSYWHDPLRRHCKVHYSRTYKGRKELLKKRGWKLIVFWEEDLERDDAEAFVLATLRREGVI